MSLLNVKGVYSVDQWKDREKYYIEKCNVINLPVEPNPKEIMKLTSEIDAVLAEALIETAYARRKYMDCKTKVGIAEKEIFVSLKQSNAKQGIKSTEAELKGLATSYLLKNKVMGFTSPIYDILIESESRLIFMEAILKLLEAKKGALVTDNGMLKLEASINGA